MGLDFSWREIEQKIQLNNKRKIKAIVLDLNKLHFHLELGPIKDQLTWKVAKPGQAINSTN